MRHPFLRGVLAAALALFLAGPSLASDRTPFSRRSPVVEAVQKTRASVVSVRVPRPNGGKDMVGTGVIVDERGFIVTNRHVVGTSQTRQRPPARRDRTARRSAHGRSPLRPGRRPRPADKSC